MPGPDTELLPLNSEAAVNQINETRGKGVEAPVLFLATGYNFNFNKLLQYYLQLLQRHRRKLVQEINSTPSAAAPATPAPSRKMQDLFAANNQLGTTIPVQGSNQSVQDIQKGLLSGIITADTVNNNLALAENALKSKPTHPGYGFTGNDALNAIKNDASIIGNELRQRMMEFNQKHPERLSDPRSRAIDAHVLAQIPDVAFALAIAPGDIFYSPATGQRDFDIAANFIDNCINNMYEEARAQQDANVNPETALNNISQSLAQFSAARQNITQTFSQDMQNILATNHLLAPPGAVQDAQNQLLSGAAKAENLKNDANLAQSSQANKPGSELLRNSDTSLHTLPMNMTASHISSALSNAIQQRNADNPDHKLDVRSLAIDQMVQERIADVSLAVALAPTDIFSSPDKGAGVINSCVNGMYNEANGQYNAMQNSLRGMPSNPDALNGLNSTNSSSMQQAENTVNQIDNTLNQLGVTPPAPEGPGASASASSPSSLPAPRPG